MVLVAIACLLNYGIYSSFCIDDTSIIYRDWFGLVQHKVPLSQLRSVENVRTHGSRGYTWLLVIHLIAAHAPAVRMPPAVLSLAES
jgi:hypothetical protein